MLEVIAEGARNVSLFDVLRWWSYEQDRGAVLAHWYDAVRDHALQHNERFPAPLPAWEVRRLAYNVASWTWSGPGAIDHPPVAQRRRGAGPGRPGERSAATGAWYHGAKIACGLPVDRRCGTTRRQGCCSLQLFVPTEQAVTRSTRDICCG